MPKFITVASTDDVDQGESTVVEANGEEIALFNVDGDFYAVENTCSHMKASLDSGKLAGTTVSCPLHGAEFDVSTGEALSAPADGPVKTYEVSVENGEIQIATNE